MTSHKTAPSAKALPARSNELISQLRELIKQCHVQGADPARLLLDSTYKPDVKIKVTGALLSAIQQAGDAYPAIAAKALKADQQRQAKNAKQNAQRQAKREAEQRDRLRREKHTARCRRYRQAKRRAQLEEPIQIEVSNLILSHLAETDRAEKARQDEKKAILISELDKLREHILSA